MDRPLPLGILRPFHLIQTGRAAAGAAALAAAAPLSLRRFGGGGLMPDVERRRDESPRGRRVVAVARAGDADDPRRDLRTELDDADGLVALVDGEPRHERHADPGCRQALHDAVLVRAEDEAR